LVRHDGGLKLINNYFQVIKIHFIILNWFYRFKKNERKSIYRDKYC
jgi:hypothetical protein